MWTLDVTLDPPLWRPLHANRAAVLGFSTRRGGVSEPPYDTLNTGRSTEDRPDAIAENRTRFLKALSLDPERLSTAGQVHGARVTRVEAPGLHAECDALITSEPGLALAVTVADCVPILLETPGAVGAVHAGWRGTAARIPQAAAAALSALAGAPASEIQVHIGPSIRACCYEVGEEVAQRFPEAARVRHGESWHLDLVAAARMQLCDIGVPETSISEVPACTACDPYWYFSYRRDGPRSGRLWAVAALEARGS